MNTRRLPEELAMDLLCRPDKKLIFKVVAVVSDAHGIFAWGWNHAHGQGTKHAEAHAIERANKKRLCGATITVVCRPQNSKALHCARPCDECMALIKKARLRKVVYSDNWSKTGWSEISL